MLAAPCQGESGQGDAEVVGDGLETSGGFEGAVVDEALGHALLAGAAGGEIVGEASAFGECRGVVFAGEDAAAEGGVGEE